MRRRPGRIGKSRFAHVLVAFLVAVGVACAAKPDPSAGNTPMDDLPVDAKLGVTAPQALAWKYRKELNADLNGDGSPETVVLASDVEMGSSGRPIWEDGHRWALVVGDRGTSTLLYAAFVPRGFVEAAVLAESSEEKREVLVQPRTPKELRALALRYEGPGKGRSSSAAYYQIESWLPGFATLPE